MANEHSSDRAQAEQQLQQDKVAYQDELRAEGVVEGSDEWNQKTDAWMEEHQAALREQFPHGDEDQPQTRERKLAEITPPSETKVKLEGEAMAKVREYAKGVDERTKKLAKNKDRQDQMDKLKAEQAEADDNERIQKQVANLETRHQDGSLTDSELTELKMHPQHVNIGSGHGNPA
jgi:hypothetical protein